MGWEFVSVTSGFTLIGRYLYIEGQTDDIGAAGAGLTAIPWNPGWDAEVQSEVTDALVAHNLDHLCLTATAGADMTSEVADKVNSDR